MDNIDNHLKPQQTGGLKLMTVFIAVLALHVVVIGGFTVYHLMSGGATDTDLVTDKTHKGVKVATDADATTSDVAAAPDKTATATPATTTPAPAPATDASTASTPPADTSDTAATSTPAPSTPAPLAPPPETPAVTIATPAPTPAPTPMVNASTPSGPMVSGPVITPIETPNGPVNADKPAAEQEAVALDGDVPAAPMPYVVKPHDSLAKIARAHHVTLAQLREANNLNSDLLHIGQKLVVPAPAAGAAAMATTVKPATHHHASHEPDRTLLGDSIPDSAVQKSVVSTPHDQALMTTSTGHHVYTVQKGDTLTKIAHKFHTTRATLVSMNSVLEDHKVHAGQKLRVPAVEPRSANMTPAPVSTPSTPRAQPAEIQPRSTPSAQLANFMP